MKKDDVLQKGSRTGNALLEKIWKIMRLTGLFLLISFMAISAGTYSQNTRFSFKMENSTLNDLFLYLEQNSGYRFAYNKSDLDDAQEISCEFTNESIDQILKKVLDTEKLSFSIKNEYIIITSKENATGNLLPVSQPVKTISGKVSDSSGAPLPGVTVMVKGTTTGVITDMDGKYTLSKVPETAILQFSFVGMKTQEIAVSGKTIINVTMVEEMVGIEEVVAVGYGTMKKSDLTGSIASVKGSDIAAIPSTNVVQALQGRTAGVQVLQNTGAPGANIQVRIRGTNSIKGSNEALWIIDGFPGDQGMLDPSDIESIEILKDASATAIYGSRGANGVVIVTTKHGNVGKTRIEYNGSFGIQTIRKKLDLMNAEEYMKYINIIQLNNAGTKYFSDLEINSAGKGTDWQDLIFRSAPTNDHSLNISGGNDKTRFSLGANFFDQRGIILNSGYRRISLKANIDHEISKKISVSFNSILSRINNEKQDNSFGNRGQTLISAIFGATPTVTPYNENGSYLELNTVYPFSPTDMKNPLAWVNEKSDEYCSNKVMANLAFTIKPVDGLSVKISGNALNTDSREDIYTSLKFPKSSGSASISTGQSLSLNSDNIISYHKTINMDHDISVMGGITYEQNTYTSLGASGTGFLSDNYETYNIGAASTINTPSSSYSKWSLLSYLGRLNYSYKGKYMATLNFRADGSSRYSKGSKWGYFPSGALAWRISNEKFFKNITQISNSTLTDLNS